MEQKKNYTPPTVEIITLPLEEGFALSVWTESFGTGYSVPNKTGEVFGDWISTTENLTKDEEW